MCRRAFGNEAPAHLAVSDSGGRLQQSPCGHVDVCLRGVSRPENHFACSNAVPTLTENVPRGVVWMREVHQ